MLQHYCAWRCTLFWLIPRIHIQYVIIIIIIIIIIIFSLNTRVQTMDFGRQRGFLLYGEDPPEKVGYRKESYFLEFMYVDVAGDFVGVVFHVLLDGVVLSLHIRSTSISKSLYFVSFSVVLTEVLVSRGIVMSMRREVLSFLFFSTMSGVFAAVVLSVWIGMSHRIVKLALSVSVSGSCSYQRSFTSMPNSL